MALALEMCMRMGFPFQWESHVNGNTDVPKMGMGVARVHVTIGMGMATFFMCAKIRIGRLDANAIQ